ncbi:MAG: MBOAT family protein [Lachnospiraceae bacterium]|nr:MBOAT family protein [Lachnospiraceae bacterium]
MVFSNIEFLYVFLPLVLICYVVAPRFLKNAVLLVFSLIFYAWDKPIYALLMIFSIIMNYVFGLIVEKEKNKKKTGKWALVVAVVLNLLLLGIFKYTSFVVSTVNHISGSDVSAINVTLPIVNKTIDLMHIALPIGISFYTFQAMSYVIDVYRGHTKANKSIVGFGTYISMFPQLIAGPIVRYKTVDKEIRERKETIEDFSEGIFRFTVGLGKKVLIANNVGALWDEIRVMENAELSTFTAWLGLFAFTLQIYFDFSGYSDMAIGLGRMFGFHFLENFDHPYESLSITEFWRRWHMSLGTWFKEYVYIPLGGNRHGMARQLVNIAIVWLLTGLWHGASWNFVIWGAYYAVLLLFEKVVLLKVLKKAPKIISWIYTFLFVVLGWGIFSMSDMSHTKDYISALFFNAGKGLASKNGAFLALGSLILLVVGFIGSLSLPAKLANKISSKNENLKLILKIVFVVVVMVLCTAFMVAGTYNPFLYFRF